MCGICGIFYPDAREHADRGTLAEMNAQISHRGPDDDGFFVEGNVGLAMRRLSIIDVKTGHQPLSNEDEKLWIVFNGEIYNHQELRADLETNGHRYRTESDTETIVHLYEQYGRDCVKHLRGMFAFAIWDRRKRTLFVARDRLGIKPFYYRSDGEVSVWFRDQDDPDYPGVKAELNRRRPGGVSGLWLHPGEALCLPVSISYSPGTRWRSTRRTNYHRLIGTSRCGRCRRQPRSYYVKTYREFLESCVSSHLMSDVPLGVFLSGGLDSSAVAAFTTKIRSEPIHTFAVGYGEESFSELPFARQVAQHIGSEHHEVRLSREEFFDTCRTHLARGRADRLAVQCVALLRGQTGARARDGCSYRRGER